MQHSDGVSSRNIVVSKKKNKVEDYIINTFPTFTKMKDEDDNIYWSNTYTVLEIVEVNLLK